MVDKAKLVKAFKNADAAGDAEAATRLAIAIKRVDDPFYTPPETTIGGYLREIPKGLAAGAAGLVESAATGAAFLLPEEQEQAAREKIAEIGEDVQESLAPRRGYRDTVVRKGAEALGSTVPFLATGFLGAPGLAAGVATGAAAGAGEAARRAEAAGATEEQISKAAGLGVLPGLGETAVPFGIGRSAMAVRKALGKATGEKATETLIRSLRRVSTAAGAEGLQEASAEVAQNLIAQGVYDPETGLFAGTGESLGYGAGVGGLLQAIAELALIPGRRRAVAARRVDAAEETKEEIAKETPTPTTPPVEPAAVPPVGTVADMFEEGQARPPATPQEEVIEEEPTVAAPVSDAQLDMFPTDMSDADVQEALRLYAEKENKTVKDIASTLTPEEVTDAVSLYMEQQVKRQQQDLQLAKEVQDRLQTAPEPDVAPTDVTQEPEVVPTPEPEVVEEPETVSAPRADIVARVQQQKQVSEQARAQDLAEAAPTQEEVAKVANAAKQAETATAPTTETEKVTIDGKEFAIPTGVEAVQPTTIEEEITDQQFIDNLDSTDPAYTFLNGKKLDEGLYDLANAYIAEKAAKKGKEEYSQEVFDAFNSTLKNLTTTGKQILNSKVEAIQSEDIDLLPASAISKLTSPVDPTVAQAALNNDLNTALEELGKSKDKTVSRVAKALQKDVGTTQITFESNIRNSSGKLIAGMFNPATNTIVINRDIPLTNHVLLHEMTHAATSHTIANASNPITKQLQTIFDGVRDRLDTAYGAESLDEFIAEAFSNPEFQASLNKITSSGENYSALDKFANAVMNVIRRLRGLPLKSVTSAKTDVDNLVYQILSPAPETRNANRIYSEAVRGDKIGLLNKLMPKRTESEKSSMDSVRAWLNNSDNAVKMQKAGLLDLLPLNAIAKMNEEQVPAIGKLLDVIRFKVGDRSNGFAKVNDTARKMEAAFKGRPKEERENFDNLVAESTLMRVDPTQKKSYYENFWYFYEDPATKSTVRSRAYATKQERDKGLADWREKNPDDFTWRVVDKDQAKVEEWDKINGMYKKLRPEQRKAYETLRDAYAEEYQTLRNVMRERIDGLTEDNQQRASLKQKLIYQLMAKESIEPYFPLYRRGEYWMAYNVYNPETQSLEPYKEAFESLRDRDNARAILEQDQQRIADLQNISGENLAQTYKSQGLTDEEAAAKISDTLPNIADVFVFDNTVENRRNRRRQNVPTEFAYDVLAELKNMNAPSETVDLVTNMLLDVMPERALARAFRPRQGIAGFERDALKVFRSRMPAFVNQINNVKFDIPLSDVQKEIRQQIEEAAQADPDSRQFLNNLNKSMDEYVEFAKDPYLAPWSKGLKSVGFGFTLGFNISSVLVNATNVPIVVLPYLGGIHGYKNASAAIYDAMGLYFGAGKSNESVPFLPFMRKRKRTTTTYGEGESLETAGYNLTNVDFSDINAVPEKYRPYKELADTLDAQAQATRSLVSDVFELENPEGGIVSNVNKVQGFAFHHGERANRQITAIAAYKLALDKKVRDKKLSDPMQLTEADRKEAALEAIDVTELTNSGAMTETAPKFAQGNIGSIVMMYKRFGISMYYLQARMARQAYMSAGDPEKARRRVLDNGGTEQQAEAAAQEAIEMKKQARRQIAGIFASSAIFAGVQGLPLYGIVSAVMNLVRDDDEEDFDSAVAATVGEGLFSGLINYTFGVDVAPRIGMTNLIYRSQPNREQESYVKFAIEQLGGPVLSSITRAEAGARLIYDGEVYRGVERMLPAAFSNGMKSLRYATEGATTLRGDPIVEDISAFNVFGQLIGLAPAGYAKQQEINARDKRIDNNIAKKRTRFLREYYMAMRIGDYNAMAEIQEKMLEFNQKHPEVAISGDTVSRSMRQHSVTSEIARQLGGITLNRRRIAKILAQRADELGIDYTL